MFVCTVRSTRSGSTHVSVVIASVCLECHMAQQETKGAVIPVKCSVSVLSSALLA